MKNSCMHTKIGLMRMGFGGLLMLLIVVACQPSLPEAQAVTEQPEIFPDYRDVTIPCNIAPLNFRLREVAPAIVSLSAGGEELRLKAADGAFSIPMRGWKRLLAAAEGNAITVTLYAEGPEGWRRYAPFAWQVAAEPIDPCLVYRKIAPGYRMWNRMGIYQRNLTNFDEEAILDNKQTNNNCMNCHSFCQQDPDRMLFHQRMTHAGTYLIQQGQIEKLDTKTEQTISALVYPYWHPSGRYVAFSTNETKQDFHYADPNRVEVFDLRSDVVVYDVERHQLLTSPLLSAAAHWETFPCFSPDGKQLYFCSADSVAMPEDYREVRYNLLRVSFDPEQGTFGTQVDTLFHAEKEGLSARFPRVSPDGEQLMFTASAYGNFSIWHRDADLYLMDLRTGRYQPMEAVNSENVESYHSWSSNSRWFVFSSRRENGLYTVPYIAYLSPDGQAGKPFLLPQASPDYYDLTLRSFNIPELVKGSVQVDRQELIQISKYGKPTAIQMGE
ncbi:MAG: hypothetical protein PUC85_05205 [bacterium]|nr:hypothetical protein [bacterium]